MSTQQLSTQHGYPVDRLFPELDDAAAIASLLERLDSTPTALFASLLDAAGPLRRAAVPEADAITTRILDRAGTDSRCFLPFFAHAAAPHLHRLLTAFEASPHVASADDLMLRCGRDLFDQLGGLALRPLVVLMRAMSEAGELIGDTPEERYQHFGRFTLSPEFEGRLAEEFPLLTPVLHRAAARTVDQLLDVLDHLDRDRGRLRDLGVDEASSVTGLSLTTSDRHRRGRAVVTVTFSCGATVVHKPRDLGVDVAYQRFLTAINAWAGTSLRTLAIVPGDDYGWMEYVATEAVPASQRTAYFEQIGQLTAVMHLLNGHDMHYNNLLCDGTGPIVIDLEGLFRPEATDQIPQVRGSAKDMLEQGVTAIGLLPLQITNGDRGAVDLGATGYRDGALSPFKSLVIHNRGRDDMRLTLEQVVLNGRQHAPSVAVDTGDAVEVADAVVRGFETVWAAVAARTDEAATLVTELFTDTRVRLIHNPTSLYVQLLRLVSGPAFLADLTMRMHALQRVGLSRPDAHPAYARSELHDLAEGDVPYFDVIVGHRGVRDGSGTELGELLPEPPITTSLRRLADMSTTALDTQTRLIRLAYVAKLPRSADRTTLRSTSASSPAGRSVDLSRAEELARQIGDRLTATQLPGATPEEPATWLGPLIGHTVEDQAWTPGILGTGLYSGSLGPAMFLAQLATVTATPRYAATARAVLEPLAAQIDQTDHEQSDQSVESGIRALGAYGGYSGIAYALAAAGNALQDPALVSSAVRLLGRLATEVDHDRTFDLIAGSGGLLATALAVHRRSTDPAERSVALAAATAAGTHLTDRFVWATPDDHAAAAKGYTGFGHGTAGLAPYLRHLARHRGPEEERYLAIAADRLTAYTGSRFDPELQDWHNDRGRTRRSYGWCHGAPGIALGHLVGIERGVGVTDRAESDLRCAARQIEQRGLGNNPTYCHGDIGNVEILTRIAAATDDPAITETARDLTARLVAGVLQHHLEDRRSRYAHTPSLLLGTSGIGHFLIRLLEPGLPSVLSLD